MAAHSPQNTMTETALLPTTSPPTRNTRIFNAPSIRLHKSRKSWVRTASLKRALTNTKEIATKNYSVNPLLPKMTATPKADTQNAARPSTNTAKVPALARKKPSFSLETAAAQSARKPWSNSFHCTFSICEPNLGTRYAFWMLPFTTTKAYPTPISAGYGAQPEKTGCLKCRKQKPLSSLA